MFNVLLQVNFVSKLDEKNDIWPTHILLDINEKEYLKL